MRCDFLVCEHRAAPANKKLCTQLLSATGSAAMLKVRELDIFSEWADESRIAIGSTRMKRTGC